MTLAPSSRAAAAGLAATATIVALVASGCASRAGTVQSPTVALVASPAPVASAAVLPIDRLTAVARRRYAIERYGPQTHALLRRVAADHGVRRLLASGDDAGLRTYVRQRFDGVWYHWHVSRMRILRGSRMLVDVGVPFVVAPSKTALLDNGGRRLATLEVSVQDVVGFVRFMHRNYPVDVVARGVGGAHVRTSLPAALRVRLPDRGTATVAGRRYRVRSFAEKALGAEPVKVWILTRD